MDGVGWLRMTAHFLLCAWRWDGLGVDKVMQLFRFNPGRKALACVQRSTGSSTRLPQDVLIPNGGSAAREWRCASVIPRRLPETDVFFSPSCPFAGASVFRHTCSIGPDLEFEHRPCTCRSAGSPCRAAPSSIADAVSVERAGAHSGSPGKAAGGCYPRDLRSSL